MSNIPQLVAAVVAHAKREHEDSVWDIVITGMTRDEVAEVITKAGAKTPKGAIRAMRDRLDDLVLV
jgi:hypothetical protein